ncbi:helix-turn-helix domain-containing protein [Mycobacterium hodleri]|uniref:Helix-turn-helix domain-containing protein n=1 Tax=Mycolicibacterium hodleri TaxID=49897 RepID=A0A544W749_9MYCO|nr:helix-turn-helix domain-containing protein [Mycolicibacterium hodleri]
MVKHHRVTNSRLRPGTAGARSATTWHDELVSLVLDTTALPQGDRADALREAMQSAGITAHVMPFQKTTVQAKMHLWKLDRSGTTLMHRVGTGLWLERTHRQAQIASEQIALTLLSPRSWTFNQYRTEHASGASPALIIVNQAEPYDHRRHDFGSTIAVNIDRSLLDLPMDTVARASRNLSSANPLHGLVGDYLKHAVEIARESPTSAEQLSSTTVQLTRALICAAAGDPRTGEAMSATLVDRIKIYIDAHATDPALSADVIAAAHNISVRHLYNVWRTQEMSLANRILQRRLERARDQLADPTKRHLTVAAIGRACGFSDPTHFGRRFRAAYGTTPREWRNR